LSEVEIFDYDGPLGIVGDQLVRRRIAVAADVAGRPYLIRPDSVVIDLDEEHPYAAARDALRSNDLEVLGARRDEAPTSGMLGARLAPQRRRPTPSERWRIADVAELVDELRDAGWRARPNHVYLADGVGRHFGIVSSGGAGGTPGVTPADLVALRSTARPASPLPLPTPLALPWRRPPNVLILDTGLATSGTLPAHDALRGHCVVHSPWLDRSTSRFNDEDEPDDDLGGRLDRQGGHGTFISGIVRRICPDARIHHAGVLSSYGDGDDASVTSAIERALLRFRRRHEHIDIVVMSFGSYADSDQPPPMTEAIRRLLRRSVVVASAGNDATSRPCYPAALPGVVAVGALDAGGRSRFSNFGPWVDASAPGVDVVSTFFTDFDDCDEDGNVVDCYRGWASWSGTSFAAPKVAGVIAQTMYLRETTAQEAWAHLAETTPFHHPDLGVVFNA
jgi:subtilisin family serine protease